MKRDQFPQNISKHRLDKQRKTMQSPCLWPSWNLQWTRRMDELLPWRFLMSEWCLEVLYAGLLLFNLAAVVEASPSHFWCCLSAQHVLFDCNTAEVENHCRKLGNILSYKIAIDRSRLFQLFFSWGSEAGQVLAELKQFQFFPLISRIRIIIQDTSS